MVVGARVDEGSSDCYRRGHRTGNRLFNSTVTMLFRERPVDMLTGYRAFSRRYAKSFPGMARGFEVEAEMTLHALDLRLPVMQLPTAYRERPADSVSKLNTYKDGMRILSFLLAIFHWYRPMAFYGALGALAALAAAVTLLTGGVHFAPWTAASVAFVAAAVGSILLPLVGASLEAIRRGQREMKRMIYLSNGPSFGAFDWL